MAKKLNNQLTIELAELITARSPASSTEQIKEEAIELAFDLWRNLYVLTSDIFPETPEEQKSQLETISKLSAGLHDEMQSLAYGNEIELMLQNDLDADDLSRITRAIDELSSAASKAIAEKPLKSSGPREKLSDKSFIEAGLQVYEQASGLPRDGFLNDDLKLQRLHKAKIYTVFKAAVGESQHFQSFDALKKAIDRYIDSGRPYYDNGMTSRS